MKMQPQKAMAQLSRVSAQFDIKCSAEKFYREFNNNTSRLVQLLPETVTGYKILHGNGFGNGAVIVWNYDIGKPMIVKLRQEANDAAKTITFTTVGGDLLEKFKSFVVKLKVEHGSAKWSIEFEKINSNSPNPTEYLELYRQFTRALDAYLSKA